MRPRQRRGTIDSLISPGAKWGKRPGGNESASSWLRITFYSCVYRVYRAERGVPFVKRWIRRTKGAPRVQGWMKELGHIAGMVPTVHARVGHGKNAKPSAFPFVHSSVAKVEREKCRSHQCTVRNKYQQYKYRHERDTRGERRTTLLVDLFVTLLRLLWYYMNHEVALNSP